MSRLNKGLRGLKLALPALRSFSAGLGPRAAAEDAVARYTGFKLGTATTPGGFDVGVAKVTAAFYAGNIIEHKAMSLSRTPQMAGRKKILAILGQYLPEIQAAGDLASGADLVSVGSRYGQNSIGYENVRHGSFLENAAVRNRFLATLAGRIGLSLVSRFAGPMINPHLPKGINI